MVRAREVSGTLQQACLPGLFLQYLKSSPHEPWDEDLEQSNLHHGVNVHVLGNVPHVSWSVPGSASGERGLQLFPKGPNITLSFLEAERRTKGTLLLSQH